MKIKKIMGLFLLPLVNAHHEGNQQVLNTSQNSSSINSIIFILIIFVLVYYLLKGGSRK